MDLECSPETCPGVGLDNHTSIGKLKLVRSVLDKGQDQGMQQNANFTH